MQSTIKLLLPVAAALCAWCAQAAPQQTFPNPQQQAGTGKPSEPASSTLPAGWGKTVDASRLSDQRGGTDVHNEADLGGAVTGNVATNVNTGSNIIDNGSFANSTGLPVVIQNSGANVLIQNATVINLQLQ